MKARALNRRRIGTQRGVGTIVIVMVLFFVVSLAAAYASRNMIFEQRTSSNQARSTLAFEAAEAGVEWTLAQLNGGKVDDDCVSTTAAPSFQSRYVTIAANGNLSPFTTGRSPSTDPKLWPTCVHNGVDGWNCACPNTSNGALTVPGGVPPPLPAFRIWPATPEPTSTTSSPWTAWSPPIPGLMPVNVVGCTSLAVAGDNCLDYYGRANLGEASAGLRVWLALRSGLAVPPAAAVTARTRVVADTGGVGAGVKLIVVNDDAGSGGFTVNTGLDVNRAHFTPRTIAGTPGSASFADSDSRLAEVSTESTATGALTGGERMFALMFGMSRGTYREQPGLRVCDSPCTAAGVNTLLANNPNRVIWVEGDLTVDADIGDPGTNTPVLMIINGDALTLNAGRTIYGFVYMTGGSSADSTINLPAGATSIRGAVVAEGRLLTSYASTPAPTQELTITFDRAAMDKLRTSYGSWVRAPGGWADFKAVP